jgi:hypothetical protein
MSTTVRWIIAVLVMLFGIGAAAFAVFGGAFSTVACVRTPPDWVYYVLLIAGLVTLAACVVPAVLLVRRVRGPRIVLVLLMGLVLSCGGYGAYMAALSSYC